MYINTEWDVENQGLLAYNRYNPDFGTYLAFTCSVEPASSFTGDRAEFLGRNHPQTPLPLPTRLFPAMPEPVSTLVLPYN